MQQDRPDIHLSALRASDVPLMLAWRNDPEIARMVVSPIRFVSLETETEWNARARTEHEQGRTLRLGIRTIGEDRLVGVLLFTHVDHVNQNARTGIMIGDRALWGKGLAKQAYAIALPYAFNELNLHSLRSYVLSYNQASQGLYRSLGFVHEGTQRAAIYKGGRYVDLEMFSLLRPDHRASDTTGTK